MPAAIPIIAAVAGAAASAGAASALAAGTFLGFSLGFSLAAGSFALSLVSGLIGAAVSFAVSALGGAFVGGAKQGSTAVQGLSDRKRTVRESASPRRVVIGRVRVGGALIFVHARDADGVKDKYLTLVLALAGHRIKGMQQIYLGDDPIDDPKFAGLVRWELARGTTDQAAPQWVIDETAGKWSASHRCRGCAVLYIRLTKNSTAFPNGLPEIACLVEGNDEIFDPRTGTTGYSANAALAVAWYLRSPLGLNEPADAIDADALIAAANICDEAVPLKNGGTEKRYRCHGTFTLDEQPQAILAKLLSASAGDAIYAGGRWYIEPAAWRPSNRVITQHELRGPITVARNRAFRDLANGIRATYVREAAGWEETDAPPLLDAAARAQDGGEAVFEDLALPFTLSGTCAQRIMQIRLRRLRAQRSYQLPVMLHHVGLRPGSVVTLDLPRQQRDTIRLTGWSLAEDGAGVILAGEQDSPDIYAWNPQTDERPLPPIGDVNAPAGTNALTPVLTLTAPSAPAPTSIAASWTAVTGATGYELEWRTTATGPFTVTTQAGTSATITTGARAEMRVRAVQAEGGFSEYDSAPFPAALTRLVVAGVAGGIAVEWSGATQVQVFTHSSDAFASATLLASPTGSTANLTLAAGTYFVWARPVGTKGAVGVETGPIQVTAEDPLTGGVIGTGDGAGAPGNGAESESSSPGDASGGAGDADGGSGGSNGGET